MGATPWPDAIVDDLTKINAQLSVVRCGLQTVCERLFGGDAHSINDGDLTEMSTNACFIEQVSWNTDRMKSLLVDIQQQIKDLDVTEMEVGSND